MENEVEQLKKDLEVENDSDVHFIQGDFYNYYTEQDIIGEGTTGTVKRCMKNGTNDIYAVKIVHYRDDTEMLVMVSYKKKTANRSRLLKNLKIKGNYRIRISLKSMKYTSIITPRRSTQLWSWLSAKRCSKCFVIWAIIAVTVIS